MLLKTSMRPRNSFRAKKMKNRVALFYEIDEEEGTSQAQREEKFARWLNADPRKISLAQAERLTESFFVGDPLFQFAEMLGSTRKDSDWRPRFQKLQDSSRQLVRRRRHLDGLLRICPNCNRAFLATKSLKQEFCDDDCRRSRRNAARKGTDYYSKYRKKRRNRLRALARWT